MRATSGVTLPLSLALLLTCGGCDDGDDASCPESMWDTSNGLSCSQAEGTRCVYDCNGCGGPHVATCKGGVWETFYTCECPAEAGIKDTMPRDTMPADTVADQCCYMGAIIPCFCPDAGIPCVDERNFVDCGNMTCVKQGLICPSDGGPAEGGAPDA